MRNIDMNTFGTTEGTSELSHQVPSNEFETAQGVINPPTHDTTDLGHDSYHETNPNIDINPTRQFIHQGQHVYETTPNRKANNMIQRCPITSNPPRKMQQFISTDDLLQLNQQEPDTESNDDAL